MESEAALLGRIKAVVFDPKALGEECTKAFEAAGATPIREQLAQDNLRFITESVFTNPQHDNFWAPDKEFADGMRSAFNSTKKGILRLSTAADVSQTGDYKGLRYIGLTNAGIRGGTFPFSDTIIHSLLHSGGAPRLEGATTRVDLQISTEMHDEILKICGRG